MQRRSCCVRFPCRKRRPKKTVRQRDPFIQRGRPGDGTKKRDCSDPILFPLLHLPVLSLSTFSSRKQAEPLPIILAASYCAHRCVWSSMRIHSHVAECRLSRFGHRRRPSCLNETPLSRQPMSCSHSGTRYRFRKLSALSNCLMPRAIWAVLEGPFFAVLALVFLRISFLSRSVQDL